MTDILSLPQCVNDLPCIGRLLNVGYFFPAPVCPATYLNPEVILPIHKLFFFALYQIQREGKG